MRFAQLTDPAFRLYMMALLWSVSNRTEGIITDKALRLIPYVDHSCAPELTEVGLWRRLDGQWLIVDYADTQTTKAQLAQIDANRRMEREKKARQRAQAKISPGDVPEATSGGSPDGLVRLGKAKARQGEEDLPPAENLDVGEAPDDTTPWGWPAEEGSAPRPSCSSCGKDPGGFALIEGRCRKCRFG